MAQERYANPAARRTMPPASPRKRGRFQAFMDELYFRAAHPASAVWRTSGQRRNPSAETTAARDNVRTSVGDSKSRRTTCKGPAVKRSGTLGRLLAGMPQRSSAKGAKAPCGCEASRGEGRHALLAARLGLEPRLNGSEPFVLPLHHRAIEAPCGAIGRAKGLGGCPATKKRGNGKSAFPSAGMARPGAPLCYYLSTRKICACLLPGRSDTKLRRPIQL